MEAHELYDRAADPAQLVNLATRADLAETLTMLREKILDWMLATADVLPWQADRRFDTEGAIQARVEDSAEAGS